MTYSHFGKQSKPDKLVPRRGGLANGSSPPGWDLSSIPLFPRPIKFCSPLSKPILLEEVCAKQEHLIAMTKIKYSSQTRVVLQKLKYFWEPAIFIEVWNLALCSRLACAQWVWEGEDHIGSSCRNILIPRNQAT